MTHPDLADQLTRSLGEAPAEPALSDVVVAGRTALARRRLGASAVAVVAVLAVVGGGMALTSGSEGSGVVGPAGQSATASTPSTPASPDATTVASPQPVGNADLELTARGVLLVRNGVTVVKEVPNPLDVEAPDRSLGVVYRTDGATTWALLTNERTAQGRASSISTDPAGKAYAHFGDWLAVQVALERGEPDGVYVTFGSGGALVPVDGVEILEQTSDFDLGDSFSGPGDRAAAAEVRIDGRRLYVLARQISGSAIENIPTDISIGGPTLADFLDYAQQQYSGGEGLR